MSDTDPDIEMIAMKPATKYVQVCCGERKRGFEQYPTWDAGIGFGRLGSGLEEPNPRDGLHGSSVHQPTSRAAARQNGWSSGTSGFAGHYGPGSDARAGGNWGQKGGIGAHRRQSSVCTPKVECAKCSSNGAPSDHSFRVYSRTILL